MMKKVVIGIVLVFFVAAGAAITMERVQTAKLNEWARSVPLTPLQREVLWDLWSAYLVKQAPKKDPLRRLSKKELDQLKELSIPSEFAKEAKFSMEKFLKLKTMGFSAEQRAIIMGMAINHIGRQDIHDR